VVAERVGFEPTVPVKAHTLSKRARSATLAPLRVVTRTRASRRTDPRALRLVSPNRLLSPLEGTDEGPGSGGEWRRGWDSNPRYLAVHWFSKPARSATLAPLRTIRPGSLPLGGGLGEEQAQDSSSIAPGAASAAAARPSVRAASRSASRAAARLERKKPTMSSRQASADTPSRTALAWLSPG
jgi:hypothetical protein